jgi:hypothetical protein
MTPTLLQTKLTPRLAANHLHFSAGSEERTCAHKARKWLAMATEVYLLVIGSAYQWDMAQHPTDGKIFDPIGPIEREGIRRPEDERAREAAAGP